MRCNNIRKTFNKCWMIVRSCTSSYPFSSNLLAKFICIFYVKFMQSFNMIINKCNGNQHQILLSSLHQGFYCLLSPGFKPGKRTNLTLPGDTVRIAPA